VQVGILKTWKKQGLMMKAQGFRDFAAKGATALLGRQGGAEAKPAAASSAPPSTPPPTRGVAAQTIAASNSARAGLMRRMGFGGKKSSAVSADKAGLKEQPVYEGLSGPINIPPRKPPQESVTKASTGLPDPHKDASPEATLSDRLRAAVQDQKQLLSEMQKHNDANQRLVANQDKAQEKLETPLSATLNEGLSDHEMSQHKKMAELENPGFRPAAAAVPAPAPQGMKRKADVLDSLPSGSAKKQKPSSGDMHTGQANGWTPELNLLVDGFKAAEAKKEMASTQKPALSQQAVGYLARAADQFKKADTVEKEIQNIAGKFATPEQREKGVAMLKGRVAELRARGTELKQLAGIRSPAVGGKPSGAAQQMKGAEWFAAKNGQADKATDQIKTELLGTTELVRSTLTA
jgi:hypothetical protein